MAALAALAVIVVHRMPPRARRVSAGVIGVLAVVLLVVVVLAAAFLSFDRSVVPVEPEGHPGPGSVEQFLTRVTPQRRGQQPQVLGPDDWSRWQRSGALNFEDVTTAPDWLADGAGSVRVQERVGNVNFLIWKPGPAEAVAGFSSFEADQAAAVEMALLAAREKIVALALRHACGQNAQAASALGELSVLARRIVREGAPFKTDAALEDGDVAVQRAQLSYGACYRAAVRLPAAPAQIAAVGTPLIEALNTGWVVSQRRYRHVATAAGSLLLIVAVIFALFCFINAGRHGWMAWPLRIAAACVLVILVAGMYYVHMRMGMTVVPFM